MKWFPNVNMKNRQSTFESLDKVPILTADRHDTPFSHDSVRPAYNEHSGELANLGSAIRAG